MLTMVTMIYFTFPGLTAGSWYLLTNFGRFPQPPHPVSGNGQSVPCFCELGFYKATHISEIVQYLYFSVWFISLIMMTSRSTLVKNVRISFFYDWILFHCMYVCTHIYIYASYFFIHSSINGHLGCCPVLAAVSNAAMCSKHERTESWSRQPIISFR